MLKFRKTVMAMMAAGVLLTLSSVATAQLPQSVVDQLTPKYRAGGQYYVCRDPWITIAISDAFAGTRGVNGVGDAGECNKELYGGQWSSYAELYQLVKNALTKGGFTITKQALGDGTIRITSDFGQGFVRHELIGNSGSTLLSSDGAGIVAQGGGNITIHQGSNVISDGSASVVGTGGSSYHLLSADGNEMRINMGRYLLLLRRGGGYSPSNTSNTSGSNTTQRGGSDDQILMCVNKSARALRDWSPTPILLPSMTVTSGTVNFVGSVSSQSNKDSLINSAKSCGARAVNADRLRVVQ
jgi:hypothetical protein